MTSSTECVRSWLEAKGIGRLTVQGGSDGADIILPVPDGAEYGFVVTLLSDGEMSINAAPCASSEPVFFWHLPYELLGSSPSDNSVEPLLEDLELLISHPSRIRQCRGLLAVTYRCEVLLREQWVRVGGIVSALHWWQRAALSLPRRDVFQSPAIIDEVSGVA